MCEDGATVAATPTFLHSGQLRAGRTGSVSMESTLQETPIKYYKCPTFVKRRRFLDIWLALQDRYKYKKMQNESENRLKNIRM